MVQACALLLALPGCSGVIEIVESRSAHGVRADGSVLGAEPRRPDAKAEGVAATPKDDQAPAEGQPQPPGVGLMHTLAQLQFMRDHRAEEPWKSAIAQLLGEAEASLGNAPNPVGDYDVPFYYEDPDKSQAAKEGLREDAFGAYAAALGYQLAETGAKRNQYAAKAVELLSAWATVNKEVSGADGDLVVIYAGIPLLYAADLVMNYEGWDPAGREAFKGWVRAVFWQSADNIKDRANNWGAWGTLGAIASATLVGDAGSVAQGIERIQDRIEESIDDSGELPDENKRTNSGMWYTFFALTSMTTAAQIALNTTGVNLFTYVSPSGRTFKLALDKEFFYATHPDQWPYLLPDGIAGDLWRLLYPCGDEIEMPTASGWPGNLFEMMSDKYQVTEWESWVKPSRPHKGSHGWVYATLMRQTP